MDLSKQVRAIVSKHDPALDRSQMPMERYEKTRDPSLVVALPGMEPRWFDVRRLGRTEYEAVNGLPFAKRISGFVVFGLVRVRQGMTTIEPTREIPDPDGRAVMRKVWNEEPGGELDALYDSMPFKTWLEVASVIEQMAGMLPGEACCSCDERFSQLR